MASRSELARQLLVMGMQNVGQTPEQCAEAWKDAANYAGVDLQAILTQTAEGELKIDFTGSDACLGESLLKEAGVLAEIKPEAAEEKIREWFEDCRFFNR